MGFFNRRTAPADANTSTSTAAPREKHSRRTVMSSSDRRHKRKHSNAAYGDGTLNKRPSFGHWIKVTWPDVVTMIVMGIIGLGVYEAPPAPSRSFPVYFPDGDIVYPEFAYPLRNEIVPIWAAALLAALIPIAVILFMQIRIRSFWDVNNGVIGLLYSLITAAVFQVFLKWLIGGLRPHFLDVCKPAVPTTGAQTGNGLGGIMLTYTLPKLAAGNEDDINDSLESFPSGHTTAAFGGFIFLYLYLNAKLKVFSNYHPAYWKLIVTYMPVLGAVLIGGALTIDEFHNWYDVFAGAVIGTVMAFSAYRMVYASVWDFRFNHIPLIRDVPFGYTGNGSAVDAYREAMWTRQAGWGMDEEGAGAGAPFDAAGGLGGAGGMSAPPRASADGYHGRRSIDRRPVGGRGEQMV